MTPKIAQTVYAVGTIIPVIMSIFLLWGGLSQEHVDGVNNLTAGIVTLVGAIAPATATARVARQRKDGTFDTLAPADQVINGVQAILEAKNQALAEVERVKAAVGEAVSSVPALSPVVVPPLLDPLAKQFIDTVCRPNA